MKSLNKTLDILELIMTSPKDEMSLAELTDLSGLKKTTVNRILKALNNRGYLRQLENRGKYSIGGQLIHLSNIIKHKVKIRDIAMPYLVQLSESIEELVTFINVDNHRAYVIEEIHPNYPLRIVYPESGGTNPLYSTSEGKLCLASMSEEELDKYLNSVEMIKFTPNTITGAEEIKKHIRQVAQEDIAYDDEEHFKGMRSVAVAIRNTEGKIVHGVVIMGPSARITRPKMKRIARIAHQCALEISRALGYTTSVPFRTDKK